MQGFRQVFEERESAVRRMESLPRVRVTAVAAGLGCAALLGGLLAGSDAAGKGKGKGGARVTSTSQAAILDAGAVTVEAGDASKEGPVTSSAASAGTVPSDSGGTSHSSCAGSGAAKSAGAYDRGSRDADCDRPW